MAIGKADVPTNDPPVEPAPEPAAPVDPNAPPSDELPGDEAADLAGAEMKARADELEIEGRGSMTASQLRSAIRRAERPTTATALAEYLGVTTKTVARQAAILDVDLGDYYAPVKVDDARAIAARVRRYEVQGRAADSKRSA
jgi:hypothetical protein